MKKTAILILAAAMLSSCHIYKKYERPESISTDNVYRDVETADDDSTSMGNMSWKEIFKDPKLQSLIETGLSHNIEMEKARLNMEAAEASLKMSRRAFAPSVVLNPTGSIARIGAGDKASDKVAMMGISLPMTSKTYGVPVAASWELDIFGKLLNEKRSAKVAVMQSEAYAQAVQTQIVASIATLYYQLLSMDKQLQISEQTSINWDKTAETMKEMKLAGMMNEAAIVQTEANCFMIKANLADLRRNIRETENALSILLGQPVQHIDRGQIDEQEMPEAFVVGVPATLLANRPDVRAAELAFASAYYNTNIARSCFYPSITITGTASWLNNATGAAINPGQWLLNAAGSMLMPLFNRGKLIAQLKVAKVKEEAARLEFQHAILNAGNEVSNAIFLYNTNNEKKAFREKQVENLEKSVEYTNELLRIGTSSYLEVLTAQQSLLAAQLSVENDRLESLISVVKLYQALGGGRN